MIRTVQIGKFKLFVDDDAETVHGHDPTGERILDNGVNFERHVYNEIKRLIPYCKGFIDIGCNVGLYSVAVKDLKPECHVTAIDASRHNIKLLSRSVFENGITGIDVLNVALSDKSGIIQIGNSRLNNTCHLPGIGAEEYAPAMPISYFKIDWSGPVLIKMDIEGFEYMALKGLDGAWENNQRPTFIFELFPMVCERSNCTPIELLKWFFDRRYRVTMLDYFPGTRRICRSPEDAMIHLSNCFKQFGGAHEITDMLAEPI